MRVSKLNLVSLVVYVLRVLSLIELVVGVMLIKSTELGTLSERTHEASHVGGCIVATLISCRLPQLIEVPLVESVEEISTLSQFGCVPQFVERRASCESVTIEDVVHVLFRSFSALGESEEILLVSRQFAHTGVAAKHVLGQHS